MGHIEEPKDVDLVIAGGKLTAEDRRLIRAMIRRQKLAAKVMSIKSASAGAGPARIKRQGAKRKVRSS